MIIAEAAEDKAGVDRSTAREKHPGNPAGSADAWLKALQLYRFPLALAVVAVHCGEFVLQQAAARSSAGAGGGLGLWIVAFLTLVSRLATPSFLVIAGFLFFRNGPMSIDQYRHKVRSRFTTLVVPFLVWNLFAILLFCAPGAGKFYFLHTSIAENEAVGLRSLTTWLVGWPVYPANAPLWFVRDLVLLVLLAPLFNLVPKRALGPGILLVGLYWMLGPVNLIPGGIPRSFSVLFFAVGAWMGLNNIRLKSGPATNRLMLAAAVVFALSAALGATLGTQGLRSPRVEALLENLARVSGVLLVLCNAAKTPLANRFSDLLRRLSPASFFLFAMHFCVLFCLLRAMNYIPQAHIGTSYPFLMFGLLCGTVVGISLGCYFLLRRFAPGFLAVLDGNRSGRGVPTRAEVRETVVSALPLHTQRAPLLD